MHKIFLVSFLINLLVTTHNFAEDTFEKFLENELINIRNVFEECAQNIESELDVYQLYYLMGEEVQTMRIIEEYKLLQKKAADNG